MHQLTFFVIAAWSSISMSTDVIVWKDCEIFEVEGACSGGGGSGGCWRCKDGKRLDTKGDESAEDEPPLWCLISAILLFVRTLVRTLLRPSPIRSKGIRNERLHPVQSDTLRLTFASTGSCSLSSDFERPCCKWSEEREDCSEDWERGSCSTEPFIELDSPLWCEPKEMFSCHEFDRMRWWWRLDDNISDSEICRDIILPPCCWCRCCMLSRDTEETDRPKEEDPLWDSMNDELNRLYHFKPSCLL